MRPSTIIDVYSTQEIAKAAGVAEELALAAAGSADALVPHAEAVGLGRILRRGTSMAPRPIQMPAPSSFNASELAGVVDLFAVAASTVIAGTIVVLAVAVSQTNRATGMFHAVDISSASSSVTFAEASRAAGAPIALVSLPHEQSDARLTIRDVVCNSAGGLELPHLTAVVLLFNRIGMFAGAWRAAVDAADLEPGAEAHFSVSVPHVSDIGRYRVSFSTEDHVVPHVDKRDGA